MPRRRRGWNQSIHLSANLQSTLNDCQTWYLPFLQRHWYFMQTLDGVLAICDFSLSHSFWKKLCHHRLSLVWALQLVSGQRLLLPKRPEHIWWAMVWHIEEHFRQLSDVVSVVGPESDSPRTRDRWSHTVTHCHTLSHIVTHCDTVTHCNTL